LRFFHFNQYQKQRLVRGDIIQWLVALKFHRLCVLDLIDQKMFCFGIDGVNEITNVPSYKYHKHLIFLKTRQLLCYLIGENNRRLLLRFFHFNQYQKQRLVRGDIIQCFGEIKMIG
jgi:hypothetical protein